MTVLKLLVGSRIYTGFKNEWIHGSKLLVASILMTCFGGPLTALFLILISFVRRIYGLE